jgi:hypothetical protein
MTDLLSLALDAPVDASQYTLNGEENGQRDIGDR